MNSRASSAPSSSLSSTASPLYAKLHTALIASLWSLCLCLLARSLARSLDNNVSVALLLLQVELVPSSSALVLKALGEPPRDRKKDKANEVVGAFPMA